MLHQSDSVIACCTFCSKDRRWLCLPTRQCTPTLGTSNSKLPLCIVSLFSRSPCGSLTLKFEIFAVLYYILRVNVGGGDFQFPWKSSCFELSMYHIGMGLYLLPIIHSSHQQRQYSKATLQQNSNYTPLQKFCHTSSMVCIFNSSFSIPFSF